MAMPDSLPPLPDSKSRGQMVLASRTFGGSTVGSDSKSTTMDLMKNIAAWAAMQTVGAEYLLTGMHGGLPMPITARGFALQLPLYGPRALLVSDLPIRGHRVGPREMSPRIV